MSVNGKRVLAASAKTTQGRLAIEGQDLNSTSTSIPSQSNGLIDQLAGGLSSYHAKFDNQSNGQADSDFDPRYHTYSIDDEEIDEPPVPIPATWHQTEPEVKTGRIAEQIRSSMYGFLIGLFFVVPAMMLLTTVQTEKWPSWQEISEYARGTYNNKQIGVQVTSVSPDVRQIALQQSQNEAAHSGMAVSIATSFSGSAIDVTDNPNAASKSMKYASLTKNAALSSAPAPSKAGLDDDGGRQIAALNTQIEVPLRKAISAADMKARNAAKSNERRQVENNDAAVAAFSDQNLPKASLMTARNAIDAGKMPQARVMLARLASLGDSLAIFALAETFDPNVLAAWGRHAQQANAEKARMFYTIALSQGVAKAQARIEALK